MLEQSAQVSGPMPRWGWRAVVMVGFNGREVSFGLSGVQWIPHPGVWTGLWSVGSCGIGPDPHCIWWSLACHTLAFCPSSLCWPPPAGTCFLCVLLRVPPWIDSPHFPHVNYQRQTYYTVHNWFTVGGIAFLLFFLLLLLFFCVLPSLFLPHPLSFLSYHLFCPVFSSGLANK